MSRFLTAICIATCTVALGAQAIRQAPMPQRDAPPPVGTGTIAGVVVSDDGTQQPLKRVAVTLNATDGSLSTAVMTDDAGRFSFTKLPARRFSLSVNKPGYVRTTYGALRPGGPGTLVTLGEGQQLNSLAIRLPRGAVITGRIVDETGQPAQGIGVRVMQFRTLQGERTLTPFVSGGLMVETTDDQGMYRLYGLPAGEYVIAATPRPGMGGEIRAMTPEEIRAAIQAAQQPRSASSLPPLGPTAPGAGANTPGTSNGERREYATVAYAPVYYPGTTHAPTASPVSVRAGEERAGVDFQMQLVRTARIEGTVMAPDGIPTSSVQLTLTPSGEGAMAGALTMTPISRATPDAEGKFSFTAVGPGQYTLSARATQRPAGRGGAEGQFTFVRMAAQGGGDMPPVISMGGPNLPTYWADAEVTVAGTNLSNVALSLQPGMTLAGRIQFAGAHLAPPTDLSRARVTLMPVQSQGGAVVMVSGGSSAQVDANGRFTMQGVVPGRYRFEGIIPVEGSASPWRLKSVIVGGKDVFDFPMEIGPGESANDAVLTFTDVTQEVSGTLQDATGRPAPDYTIVVFPADRRLWNAPMTRRIRSTRPGTDGRFTVTNLPTGDYRIAALTDIAPGEQTDPAFLEQLVAASVAFSLKDGEKKVQDFRISGR